MTLLDDFGLALACIGGAIGGLNLLLALASEGHTKTHHLVRGHATIILAVLILQA